MVNKTVIKLGIISLFMLFLLSCGTTHIACPEAQAEIYMDNSYIGQGDAEISSIGFPNTVELEARRGGRVIGKTEMSRRFTFGTFCWGVVSYYTGWIWGWYYPDYVNIPLNQGYLPGSEYKSLWDYPQESVWMKPLHAVK